MTDLTIFQCWAGCFALFLAATYALLIRVALIPRVVVREEVAHSVPRPAWQLVFMFGALWQKVVLKRYLRRGGRWPKERPSWRIGYMFGNSMQRVLYTDPWTATWTAILVVVQAAWTSYVTVDRAFFHISLPSGTAG